MVVIQRKQIRQSLGLNRIGGYLVGTSALSLGANAAFGAMDRRYANPDFSGENLYQRAWVRVASVTYQVGSFNAPSGAWVSGQFLINAVPSGADFEVSEKINPDDLDRFIDETIARIPVRQEVGLQSIDGATYYGLEGVASPHTIKNVMAVYYFGNPSSTVNRDRHEFIRHEIVTTPTGLELRIPADQALGASMQIMIDAILRMSLGPNDAATFNIPDPEWVTWGAAARAYNSMLAAAAQTDKKALKEQRDDAAREFTTLSWRYMPEIYKELTFERGPGGIGPLDDWGNWQ